MNKICDNLITERLAKLPNSRAALEELCNVADAKNGESFYLAFLDPWNFPYGDKDDYDHTDTRPFIDNSPHWIMKEFGNYMAHISVELDESLLNNDNIIFMRRL